MRGTVRTPVEEPHPPIPEDTLTDSDETLFHATTPQEDRRIALPELWLSIEESGSTTLPRMRRGLSGDTGQSRPRPINVAGVGQSGRAVLEHAHVDQAHHLASRMFHHVQRRLHGRPENSGNVRWFSEHTRTQSHAR